MKPSNYEINSDYAHRAEIGSVTLTLTIPANFTADGVRETTAYYNAPNALFRFRIEGGADPTMAIDVPTTISRTFSGFGILYPVTVYRKNATTIALCCRTTDGRTVTGTSATTLRATVHFFESPFES